MSTTAFAEKIDPTAIQSYLRRHDDEIAALRKEIHQLQIKITNELHEIKTNQLLAAKESQMVIQRLLEKLESFITLTNELQEKFNNREKLEIANDAKMSVWKTIWKYTRPIFSYGIFYVAGAITAGESLFTYLKKHL